MNSELEAKFDAILNKVLTRRGQRRQTHVAELKSFMSKVMQDQDFYRKLETSNLELEIKSLKKQLADALKK